MRGGETAAGHFLYSPVQPGHFDVLPARAKLDEITRTIIERLPIIDTGKVHSNNAGKVPRPFAFHEIDIVASGNNMPAPDVGFIDPIFVLQNMVFPATPEAAIEDMIAAIQSLTDAFANNRGARAQL